MKECCIGMRSKLPLVRGRQGTNGESAKGGEPLAGKLRLWCFSARTQFRFGHVGNKGMKGRQ